MADAIATQSDVDCRPASLPLPVRPFVGEDAVTIADRNFAVGARVSDGDIGFLYAPAILQDVADYRTLLRDWHAMLRIGGRLAITVPHAHLAERSLALPLPDLPTRKRLYTPASLLAEVEEALEPNGYRIRLLCDDDAGCDLAAPVPDGAGAVLLVLERVAPPAWVLATGEGPPGPPPAYAFEPAHTRRETAALAPRRRIILLKLDHLGDFMMGIPALERARALFADAEMTLVVGSWNANLARGLGLFDTVVGFDAFPRNSTEERVNLGASAPDFERLFPGEYDLAIDLRCDSDTRFFLNHLHAEVRAGLGTRAQFGYLDIFLPIDGSRHGFEAASTRRFRHGSFYADKQCQRSDYRLSYKADSDTKPPSGHVVWGPYAELLPGEYMFQPMIEIGDGGLMFDVACDLVEVTRAIATGGQVPSLRFRVEKAGARTEFRIATIPGEDVPDFSFYGGRLHRRGASSVLHQSEYLSLLIELVTMRTDRFGLLREDSVAS